MAIKSNYFPRKYGMLLDWMHIVIGVVIVIMAVLAFTDPAANMILFPLIFFLAAFLNLMTGGFYIRMYPRNRKKQVSGVLYLLSGLVILALFAVSAVSIWGAAA